MVVAFVLPTSAGTAADDLGALRVSLTRLLGRLWSIGVPMASLSSGSGGDVLERCDEGGVGCLSEARRVGDLVDEGLRELTMLLMADDHDSFSTWPSSSAVRSVECCCC